MTATTTKTPEELMAARVEEDMLTDRDTRYQLMRRILEANDRIHAMNDRRLREVGEIRTELSDVTDHKEQLNRDNDRLRQELHETNNRAFQHEARASRYLRTLHDLVRLSRGEGDRLHGVDQGEPL